jgi:hypothetical protein
MQLVPEGRGIPSIELRLDELASSWEELNSTGNDCVDLVSLGNPHFSFSEINRLASLCAGRQRHPDVAIIVTCGRATFDKAAEAGLIVELERFGVQFVTDMLVHDHRSGHPPRCASHYDEFRKIRPLRSRTDRPQATFWKPCCLRRCRFSWLLHRRTTGLVSGRLNCKNRQGCFVGGRGGSGAAAQ